MPNPRHGQLIERLGRAGVHALFPNDFELYLITLELVDSVGATVDFLSFPVNPERLTHEDQKLTNIKKSLGGISALDTETFTPKIITMSGTFGRKFKLLLSKPTTSEENAARSSDGGVFGNIVQDGLQIKRQIFDPKIKTGYGTLKILESIIDKSKGLDLNNEPFRLYLYNPALGHSYLVKANKFTASQDRNSSNMLWKYDIMLTAIAPIENLRDKSKEELSDSTDSDKLNKNGDKLSNDIKGKESGLTQNAQKGGNPTGVNYDSGDISGPGSITTPL